MPRVLAATGLALVVTLVARGARAELSAHDAVLGAELAPVEIPGAAAPRAGGDGAAIDLAFHVAAGASAVEIPACANRLSFSIDGGGPRRAHAGPEVVDLDPGVAHAIALHVKLSSYEPVPTCSSRPRAGSRVVTNEGLGLFTFKSAHAREGGGKAVFFLPKGHDPRRPAALLVGLHPWNGGIWTYAAYRELLDEAQRRDVVLLMPGGLGNSLYTQPAEDEALAAIDALARAIAVDPKRVSLWGASMGGAGATTIGFHHPDRFAAVTSFFGDSKYDLATYVRAILRDEAGAHRVNALDFADNARNLPVWLVHGEADTVSPIAQSAMLARALEGRGFAVRFDRVPSRGHEGPLVRKYIAEVVDRAGEARAPDAPARVSYASAAPGDASAYGIRLLRGGRGGDLAIDVELRDGDVHVLRARGVGTVLLPRGAFGLAPSRTAPVVQDDPRAGPLDVRWDALPGQAVEAPAEGR